MIVKKHAKGIEFLFKKNKVEWVQGWEDTKGRERSALRRTAEDGDRSLEHPDGERFGSEISARIEPDHKNHSHQPFDHRAPRDSKNSDRGWSRSRGSGVSLPSTTPSERR